MANVASLIAEMEAASPLGSNLPSPQQLLRLCVLTSSLVEADVSARAEYDRFIGVRGRHLNLDGAADDLQSAYAGKRVLVTGGTGCIGGQLVSQLRALGARQITSASRGKRKFHAVPGVEYVKSDVRDAAAVRSIVGRADPEVIFHLAAQRDPGEAERVVLETVETNAVGTLNVLRAARAFDVPLLCHASTGKAMRYYTGDVYAATKKLSEWLLFDYANEGRRTGGARFTHVVDNSIVHRNFRRALSGGIVRVHDPNISFYVQSALESAQLLLLAGTDDAPGFGLSAIRDLDEPVRLMSMALGLLSRSSAIPPIWFTGFDPGYENAVQPGLYDPRTASDLSPLINALEAMSASPVAAVPAVDRFLLTLPQEYEAEAIVDDLSRACVAGDARPLPDLLKHASYRMAQACYRAAESTTLARMQRLAECSGRRLPCSISQALTPIDTSDPFPVGRASDSLPCAPVHRSDEDPIFPLAVSR